MAVSFMLVFGVVLVGGIFSSFIYFWMAAKTPTDLMNLRRYSILLLACAVMFGSSVSYDYPATVATSLQDYWNLGSSRLGEQSQQQQQQQQEIDDKNLENFQFRFNSLYSIYSLPNIVLPIYSGSLIARFGFNNSLLILVSTVFVSAIVFAAGLQLKNQQVAGYTVMLVGRFLLGLGSETLAIVQSSLVAKHFMDDSGSSDDKGTLSGQSVNFISLSFAMAITISVGRLTSVLDYNILPPMAATIGLTQVAWFICGVGMISVASSFAIIYLGDSLQSAPQLDTLNDKVDAHLGVEQQLNAQTIPSKTLAEQLPESDKSVILDRVPNVVESPMLETNRRRTQSRQQSRQSSKEAINLLNIVTNSSNVVQNHSHVDIVTSSQDSLSSTIDRRSTWTSRALASMTNQFRSLLPRDIEDLPATYWMTILILICYSTATISFLPMATAFIDAKYFSDLDSSTQNSGVKASSLVSIPDTLSVISMPVIAYLAEKPFIFGEQQLSSLRGRQVVKVSQLIFSGVCISIAHLLFLISRVGPGTILSILGAGYATFGSVIYSLMAETIHDASKYTKLSPDSAPIDQSASELPSAAPLLLDNDGISSCSKLRKASNENTVDLCDKDIVSPRPILVHPKTQREAKVASAYGVSSCLLNATFFTTPIFIAWLISIAPKAKRVPSGVSQYNGQYDSMLIFYLTISLCGIVLTILLRRKLLQNPFIN
ncbi:hypothetical protein MP228_012501 [Amoeboaphelidium protococcarum]|nr:hypothetical protein MP228_012501 [Amoeboaphelidium protococcarum]